MLLLPQKLPADPIDSLTRLVQQPAHDTITGMRYLELAKAWFWENPAKTDSLLRIAESYLGPQQYYRGLSDVHNSRANYHYMGGRPLSACSSLDTAMQFAALDGDSLHMIGIRKNLTILRSEAGDIEGALEAIEESMRYLVAHQDSSLLAEHFVQRGLLYQQKGYRRLALKDFQTAREVHLALQETARVAEAEQHIGKTLFDESNYQEALPYFIASAKHYQHAGQQQYYAEVLTLLGTNYHRLQKYRLADSTFAASIALSNQTTTSGDEGHQKLLNSLRTQDTLDKDWDTFTSYFKAVHADFSEQLDRKFPTLSITEKRLAYLFRLGTTIAEAAALLNIQPESVRKGKYRLKKKLAAATETDNQSLEDMLRQIG